jgi:ribose-phosphate pyrophosphokinase
MFSLNGTHGSIYVETKTFTDGQLHVKIPAIKEVPKASTIITGRITNANDLFELQLITDVLRKCGRNFNMSLQLSYLMGGRMDRAISDQEPSTLKVVCDTINRMGFKSIDLFDCHSVASTALLNDATNYLPHVEVMSVLAKYDNPVVIIPDAGAEHRVNEMVKYKYDMVQCLKERDKNNQTLSQPRVPLVKSIIDRECVIIDDICDGGKNLYKYCQISKRST